MLRYLPFILLLALTIYALVDCVANDDSGMPVELPKGVWVLLIVLLPGIGPIAWLVVSRASRHSSRQGGSTYYSTSSTPASYRPPNRPARPARMRPVAPDDDPDFLASLNPTPTPDADVAPAGNPPAPDTSAPDTSAPDASTPGPGPTDDEDDGKAGPDQPGDGHDSGPRSNPGPSARS